MRPNPLRPRGSGPATRRPRFRPLVELLEARVVPSIIDHSGGFASHDDLKFNGMAQVTSSTSTPASAAQLTNGQNQAGSFFTTTRFDITKFSTVFTLQRHGPGGGLTFTIENDPHGAAALGSTGTGMGASGIAKSFAVRFDSSVLNQDLFQITLTFDGTTLTEAIKDVTTGTTSTSSLKVNIAQLVGGNTAFVGFTGGTEGSPLVQQVLTWQGAFGPTITSLNIDPQGGHPLAIASVPEGSGSFTLIVIGENFVPGAVVRWNGIPLPTTFDSNTQLQAIVPASFVAEETSPAHGGLIAITVTEFVYGVPLVSNSVPFAVTEAPLLPGAEFTFNAVEGQALVNVPVATFVDAGGPENPANPGDYSAVIDWGDGTTSKGTIFLDVPSGVFTVIGSHTYAEDGENEANAVDPFPVTTTIVHETVFTTVVSTALVAEEAPPIATPQGVGTINGVEGQLLHNVLVATFTGPSSSAGCTATINWGDGTTSTGFITGPDPNGVFSVGGTHAYAEESKAVHGAPFTITVTISCGGSTVTVTDNANIAEAPIFASGGFVVNTRELQSFTAPVATFIDSGGPENPNDPGDYTAIINWGDGTLSTGSITLSNGVFTVSGSHTYAEDGEGEADVVDVFTITTTIIHETVSASATSTAFVAEEAAIVSAQGGFVINTRELQPFTAVVATFVSANGESAGDFKATIDWGDGTTSAGTISGSNSFFTVSGSHTYAEDGENEMDAVDVFPIHVTISDGNSITVVDTANVAEEAAIVSAQGGFVINTRELQPFTAVVATFVSANGESAGDFKATIDWGDGTTSAGTISGSNSFFTVSGSHTYAEDGENEMDAVDVFPIHVTISDGNSITVVDTANVAEEAAIVSAQGGFVINTRELQPFTAVVATFVSANGESAGDFKATIDWGDGTTSAGTISGSNSFFTVSGSHTYAEDGENEMDAVDVFPIHVTISDGNSITVVDTANVAEEAAIVSAQGGFVINGVEGQAFTATVATFTSANGESAGDFKVTISWGDGTTSAGTISGGNSFFTVTGSHTYAEEGTPFHGGPFAIKATISDGNSITVTDSANIAEAPLVGTGGFTVNAVEGQSFTATVATFVDTGGAENPNDPGDYLATINWGDNTTSTGTISLSNGVFTVTGTHTYAEESNAFHGTPTITVTISHESAPVIMVTDTANVAEAPLTASGGSPVSAVAGTDFTTTVATFVDTGGPENASLDYTATVDWGDGTATTGAISGPDQNGVFTVTGEHTYAATGAFTINVTITHESAPPVTVSTSASVAAVDMPLAATGMDIATALFQGQDQMVAFFTDLDPNAQVGDFVATIDWGDGTQADVGTVTQPGGPGTPFFVDFLHAYNDAGTFTIHVHISDMGGLTDAGGAFADAFSTATVLAPSAPQGPGGGAGLPGQGLGAIKELQASPWQNGQEATLVGSPPKPVPVMLAQPPRPSRSNSAANDRYWELYSSQGNRLLNPIGLPPDDLLLAFQGMSH